MRTIFFWFVALVAPVSAQVVCPNGQCPLVQTQPLVQVAPRPIQTARAGATFKISFKNLNSMGSATCIHRDNAKAVFITAKHVPAQRGGLVQSWPCSLVSDGVSLQGRVVAQSRDADIAAVVVTNPPIGIPVMPVSRIDPPVGSQLVMRGYPHGGNLRVTSTKLLSKTQVSNKFGKPIYTLAPAPISGESGGTISYNGRLVGVVSAGDGRTGVHPGWDLLNRFVTTAFPQCQPVTIQSPSQQLQLDPRLLQLIAQQQNPPDLPAIPGNQLIIEQQPQTINLTQDQLQQILMALKLYIWENSDEFRQALGLPPRIQCLPSTGGLQIIVRSR